MQVHLLTTGQGRVRFNPNLYNCGKVCLSLLGTWAGPGWDPARSTLLEVLMAIQGQILVPDPYFNEPGFEATRNTPAGRAASEQYAAQCRADTLRHALLPALEKPPPAFARFLKEHFQRKRGAILAQLAAWQAAAARGPHAANVTATAHAIRGELVRYEVTVAAEVISLV